MALDLQSGERLVAGMVTEAIHQVCSTSVNFDRSVSVEGLLAITVDDQKVILVNVKDVISEFPKPPPKRPNTQATASHDETGKEYPEPLEAFKMEDQIQFTQGSKEFNTLPVKAGIVSRALVPMHPFRSPFKRQRGRRRFGPATEPIRLKRTHAEMAGDKDKPLVSSDEENMLLNGDGFVPPTKDTKCLPENKRGDTGVVKTPPSGSILTVKKEFDSVGWPRTTFDHMQSCNKEKLTPKGQVQIHSPPCTPECPVLHKSEDNNNSQDCCPSSFAHVLTSTPTHEHTIPPDPSPFQEEALNLVKEKKVHFEDDPVEASPSASAGDVNQTLASARCHLCGQVMSSRRNLEYHLQRHQGIYQYKCQHCGRGFSSSTNLKGHLWKHTNVKDFQCHLCGAEFIYKINLKRHIHKKHPETLVMSPAKAP